MLQKIDEADKVACQHICAEMLDRIEANETFLGNVIFSDESPFYIQ